ncbi:hypothetical protein K2P96_00395, partial [Patescibacteria group bacterium]|nr:hypothetical protein [Patescibacteria group bacterium]
IVTGSDDGFYEPTASLLKRNGIEILTPYKRENIAPDINTIVIGKHSKLNPEENEEVALALSMPEKIKSFPELLADITKDRENIVVAGSYGKSTCASLMAWCFIQNKIDVGYFFGAIPLGFEKSAHLGTAKYFILEGDEYPAYNTSPNIKSKFLYLHPKHLLLTSAEHDHVNVFPTLESYLEPYKKLVALIPPEGTIIAGVNNPNVKEVLGERTYLGYGVDGATWHAENIKYGAKTTFDLFNGEEKIIELSTTLLGKHNIENIVGVSGFLLEKNLITPEQLQKAVATFKGLKRRLDLKTEKSSVLVYEGFGSSYTKARTVFDAIKLHFPNKRIVTLFEPHTFSWRNKNNLNWYNDIFDQSDVTLIFNPPHHGEDTHEQATLAEILAKINKGNVYGVEIREKALEILEKTIKSDDLIILMSSGDLGGLIEEIPAWAEQKFPLK